MVRADVPEPSAAVLRHEWMGCAMSDHDETQAHSRDDAEADRQVIEEAIEAAEAAMVNLPVRTDPTAACVEEALCSLIRATRRLYEVVDRGRGDRERFADALAHVADEAALKVADETCPDCGCRDYSAALRECRRCSPPLAARLAVLQEAVDALLEADASGDDTVIGVAMERLRGMGSDGGPLDTPETDPHYRGRL